MRDVSYRVDYLRGGVPAGTLRFSTPPSISCQRDAEIAVTLRGTFRHDESVRYLTDELAPVMIDESGEHPLGVFRAATITTSADEAGVLWDEIEAYDRTVLLTWARLEERAHWPAGTRYDAIMQHYLFADGIPLAFIDPTDAVLATDREDWPEGTTHLEIINEMLDELSYTPIWFDARGAAQLHAYTEPGDAEIAHVYSDSGARILRPGYAATMDVFDAPNVFLAIVENPDYPEPMRASAENDAPTSPLSTISRGLRIPEVIRLDNIADQAALQAYVNRRRDESMQAAETVELGTVNEPGHGVGDVAAVSLGALAGLYREESWEMTLAAGETMTHTLRRTVML